MKKFLIYIVIIITFSFLLTGCTSKNEKYNSIEKSGIISGVDYKIYNELPSDNYDLSKRGYYIDTYNKPNSPYFYIITLGTRYTGGYSIEIFDLKIDKDLNVEVLVKEDVPCDDCTVTQALTYPYIVLELSKSAKNITVKDIDGNLFDNLN